MTTGTHVGTQVVRVRARFDHDGPLTLVNGSDHMFDLSSFLWVGYALGSAQEEALHRVGSGRLAVFKEIERPVNQALNDTRLLRLSYNSPLEVVVTISAIAGSVTFVGERLVALYNRFQSARRTKAATDTFVAAQRAIQGELGNYIRDVPYGRDDLSQLVAGAGRAALQMDQFEVEPDYE